GGAEIAAKGPEIDEPAGRSEGERVRPGIAGSQAGTDDHAGVADGGGVALAAAERADSLERRLLRRRDRCAENRCQNREAEKSICAHEESPAGGRRQRGNMRALRNRSGFVRMSSAEVCRQAEVPPAFRR